MLGTDLAPKPVRYPAGRLPRLPLRVAGLAIVLLAGRLPPAAHAAPAPAPSTGPDLRRDAVVDAVERVMPSVVNIATEEIVESRDPFTQLYQDFWGPYYRNRPRSTRYSLGSGVIIDEEGYVLTNLHVVQRARKVWVQLADGREFEADAIIGTSRRDVALLKLRAKPGDQFKAVGFARDDDLLLGETVLALGNPFGLGGSVSRGILSSRNRRPPLENEPLEIADWLQTDAAINPGSSGGPLVNLKGELIGINVAVYREGQGIGFAIPIKQVLEGLAEIYTPETQKQLWFGARFRPGSSPLTVESVEEGGPADRAGLKPGDQLIQVAGQPVRTFMQVMPLLTESRQGDVPLTVRRGQDRRSVTVHLLPITEMIRARLGIVPQELDTELARQLGLPHSGGLLVAEVEAGGPAAEVRLKPGMVITSLGGQATPDLMRTAAVLGYRKRGERLTANLLVPQQRGPYRGVVEAETTLRLR